jgi:uncharacterized protein GlcG (DUF336 family)
MATDDLVPMNTLSFTGAQRVAEAAVAAARERNVSACIVVADISGEPIVTLRMDGAPRLSADVARDKAYTVTAFKGMPTDQWWPAIADDPALVHGFVKTKQLIVFGGGVPVSVDGSLVGAIGVSGGSADQDREIAAAGAAAVA